MLATVAQVVGIIGVIVIMVAYYLLEAGQVDPHDIIYPVTNFVGAVFILFSIYFAWNLPSFLMEASWALISLYGLYKAIKKDSTK